MNAPQDTPEEQGDTYRAKVDEQDGGPGSHHAGGGDHAFHLAADVGTIPAGSTRPQPRQRPVNHCAPV